MSTHPLLRMHVHARSAQITSSSKDPGLTGSVCQGIIIISSTDHAISVWMYNHGNESAMWRCSLHSRSAQILIRWVAHERGFLVSGESLCCRPGPKVNKRC